MCGSGLTFMAPVSVILLHDGKQARHGTISAVHKRRPTPQPQAILATPQPRRSPRGPVRQRADGPGPAARTATAVGPARPAAVCVVCMCTADRHGTRTASRDTLTPSPPPRAEHAR